MEGSWEDPMKLMHTKYFRAVPGTWQAVYASVAAFLLSMYYVLRTLT